MFAAPLGILAAGQTLVMLTGGIDLSIASVATASAYLMATHTAFGGAAAVLIGLAVGAAVGAINGIGIALLGVQPLMMTLGTGLMTEGALVVYSQTRSADGPHVPQFIDALGAGKLLDVVPNDLFLWALIAICDHLSFCEGPDTAACSMRSETMAKPADWRGSGCGACFSPTT